MLSISKDKMPMEPVHVLLLQLSLKVQAYYSARLVPVNAEIVRIHLIFVHLVILQQHWKQKLEHACAQKEHSLHQAEDVLSVWCHVYFVKMAWAVINVLLYSCLMELYAHLIVPEVHTRMEINVRTVQWDAMIVWMHLPA